MSASNLKQIGIAMQLYANDHNHEFPDSMSTILANEDLTPEVFVYPSGNDTPATGPTTQAVLTNLAMPGHCSYLYFARGLLDTGDTATVTACEKQQPNAPGINVLFLDMHVEYVVNPAAQQILAALQSGPIAWTAAGGTTRPSTLPTSKP